MPYMKRGSSWVVYVGSGADRFRATVKSEEDAVRINTMEEAKWEKRKLQRFTPQRQNVTVAPEDESGVTLGYVFKITKQTRWADSKNAQLVNARHVLNFLGEKTPVRAIKQEAVRKMSVHFAESGNCGGTVNRKLSALSVMLKTAADEGWIDLMPRMTRRRESEHNTRFFEVEEEKQMLEICKQRGLGGLADFIMFGIDTGFRRMEILNFRLADVRDGKARLLAVGVAGGNKSSKLRIVPMTKRLLEMVERRKGNDRLFADLTDSKLRLQWDMLRHDMAMDDDDEFIVHTLRHTCGTRLAMAGKSAPFIQAWLGHSNIMVTQRYINLAGKGLESGTEALEAFS